MNTSLKHRIQNAQKMIFHMYRVKTFVKYDDELELFKIIVPDMEIYSSDNFHEWLYTERVAPMDGNIAIIGLSRDLINPRSLHEYGIYNWETSIEITLNKSLIANCKYLVSVYRKLSNISAEIGMAALSKHVPSVNSYSFEQSAIEWEGNDNPDIYAKNPLCEGMSVVEPAYLKAA